VSIFQTRYREAVLDPWGITDPTGYVYITTTLTINQIYCQHTVGNNLDLRDIIRTLDLTPAELEQLEQVDLIDLPVVTFGQPEVTPRNFLLLAAAGLFDFLRGFLCLECWWLWLLILLLLLLIAYLLYRNHRLNKQLTDERELNEHAAIFAAPFASDELTEEEEGEYTNLPPADLDEPESEVIELEPPKEV